MALDLGWFQDDVRDTIWKGDPALGEVPPDVIKAWEEDGAASHLLPYAKPGQEPTVFTFRALTLREKAHVDSKWISGIWSVFTEAFLIGVEFKKASDPDRMPSGAFAERTVRENGIRMLNEKFAQGLEQRNPGIVRFYGQLICGGTFLTEAEKKALSPSSTTTPSSAGTSTTGDTGAAVKKEEAAV